MRSCAVCLCLNLPPGAASGHVGVWTSRSDLVSQAAGTLSPGPDGQMHVLVPVCPEHVVDIYRDRIEGVRMAWRFGAATAAG